MHEHSESSRNTEDLRFSDQFVMSVFAAGELNVHFKVNCSFNTSRTEDNVTLSCTFCLVLICNCLHANVLNKDGNMVNFNMLALLARWL